MDERDHYSVRDDDCASEEYELHSEYSDEGRGAGGKRSSLSLEIYGLQRHGRASHVYFSNQEYYWRLEELRSAHLKNMAELERLYIGQVKGIQDQEEDGGLEGERNGDTKEPISLVRESVGFMPMKRLQRVNSQEELDFHEMSSTSDQSEVFGEDSLGLTELELDHPSRTTGKNRSFGRDMLLNQEGMTAQKQFSFQPRGFCLKPQGKLAHPTEVRVRSNSKVTVPKPFKMTLREEERKRRRVRTRSEVELENTLLRKEQEELRECRRKFRASPAPAHIHLPLYEVISRRSGQRPSPGSNHSRGNCGDGNHGNQFTNSNQASSTTSLRPFSFLERERRKKEEKIVVEQGNLAPEEERQVFKARPMPSSVYGSRQRREQRSDTKTSNHRPQPLIFTSLERGDTEGPNLLKAS